MKEWITGYATSFADPGDVAAFELCKQHGGTDEECFKVGDNGVGCWGDDTKEGSGLSCAIPPEKMIQFFGSTKAARKQVLEIVSPKNLKSIYALIKDRMPHERNIHTGAVIDLNPDSVRALGFTPPLKTKIKYRPYDDSIPF